MEAIICKGLVIRETDFGEYDRYISVLTETGRRIEVLCKGVRRRNGRMVHAVRQFCWSELTVYQGRGGKYHLKQADLIQSFWEITQQMEAYAACCYLSELVGCLTDTAQEHPDVTRLFLYALCALAVQKRDPALVKAAFELRLLAESGFCPTVACCAVCGAEEKEIWFSAQDGVGRCTNCITRLGETGYERLWSGTYAAMLHILCKPISRVFAFAVGGEARLQLISLCERYARYHTEREFESLKFYHSLIQGMALYCGAKT